MVIRDNNYLKNKKKKYLIGTFIWLIIMFSIFFTGLILNKTRNNIFTVIAAVLVLPAAQYSTQLFAILKFKDADSEMSNKLEVIKGEYSIFHSVIIPDLKGMINFEHVIVTGEKIYCIIDQDKDITLLKESFNKKIEAKGIPLNMVKYVEVTKLKNIDKLLRQIEASAKVNNQENQKEYTKLIAQMMM